MSDPFIGEIRIFANNFYPMGWLPCDGRLLNIQQSTPLYAVIGITYGGDGRSTFALPNLTTPSGVGMVPIGDGSGPGLTPYNLGETAGVTSVTLTLNQTPAHNHDLVGMNADDPHTVATPTATSWISRNTLGTTAISNYSDQPTTPDKSLANPALGILGGGQPHENRQPYLALNYYIAVDGIFPSPE